MKILQIVIKNTSTMDFSVPVLKKLAQTRPDIDLTILYCVLNRKNILRESKFWDRIFSQFKINQLDYGDFLKPVWRPFRPVLKYIFSGSRADKIHLQEVWAIYKSSSANLSTAGFLLFLIKKNSLSILAASLMQSVISYLEYRMTPVIVDLPHILSTINPEIVLFDNRHLAKFPGRDDVYRWMYLHKVKVGLLPHAPHLRDPISEFCPFDAAGEALPDFCEFWVPLKFGTPWVQIPERQKQFHITGYPGLDSDWLSWCREGAGAPKADRKLSEPLRCLFIMRRYLPQGEVRPLGTDPYIIDFEDFYRPLKALLGAFKALQVDVTLILKPHPANNYKILANDLTRLGVKNWEISHESIYSLLSQIDLAVGLFSTVVLVPVMANIPTVLIATGLQERVHSEWPLLESLYTRLSGFVSDESGLIDKIEEAINRIDMNGEGVDMVYLRRFYEDCSSERVIERCLSPSVINYIDGG